MEITIISLVVLLVILGGVCWFLWKRSKNLPVVETKKEENINGTKNIQDF